MTPDLIPGIHYALHELTTGDFLRPSGGAPVAYVGDVHNGRAKLYWFLINPDEVDAESVAHHADQERKARVTVSKRESFDVKRKNRV